MDKPFRTVIRMVVVLSLGVAAVSSPDVGTRAWQPSNTRAASESSASGSKTPHNCIISQFSKSEYDSLTEFAVSPVQSTANPAHFSSLRRNPQWCSVSNRYIHCTNTEGRSDESGRLSTRLLSASQTPPKTLSHTLSERELENFTLTAYSLDYHSTGKWPSSPGFGITASGKHAVVGRTVAVDPHVIPIGTKIVIDGVGTRVAEDTGGSVKGRHIDILFPTEAAAYQFGVRHHVRVYVEEMSK